MTPLSIAQILSTLAREHRIDVEAYSAGDGIGPVTGMVSLSADPIDAH